jgi:hypothetical protein
VITREDWDRESMIQALSEKVAKEADRTRAQQYWDELKLLINGRSKALVEQMERNRGLR